MPETSLKEHWAYSYMRVPHCMADKSDAEIASTVRMLIRSDLDHEAVVVAARDRIAKLSFQLATLQRVLWLRDRPASTLDTTIAKAKRVAATLTVDEGLPEFVLRRNTEKLQQAQTTINELLEHVGHLDILMASFWSHAVDVVKTWDEGTLGGKRPSLPVHISAHLIEDLRAVDKMAKLYVRGHKECDECGKAFRIDEAGIANHMLDGETIDHDADALHVPFALEDA